MTRDQAIPSAQPTPTERRSVILTAYQLRQALDLVAPDYDTDPDQREQEASIEWCAACTSTDGEPMAEGYRCWLSDYPEEGCIPLDRDPPEDGDHAAPVVEAQCAECGCKSTPTSMWALYCLPCIEAKIIPAFAPAATQAQAEPALYISGPYHDGSMSVCELATGRILHKFRLDGPSAPVGDGAATQPAGEEAHPDIAKLRSAVNLALTYFGMDEDESNREVFKALREAYAHAASLPEHIDRIATVFGSLRKMAEALDIDVGYLSRLRSGEKADPSDEILATLGLRRTVTYTKVRTGPYEATPLIPRTRSA